MRIDTEWYYLIYDFQWNKFRYLFHLKLLCILILYCMTNWAQWIRNFQVHNASYLLKVIFPFSRRHTCTSIIPETGISTSTQIVLLLRTGYERPAAEMKNVRWWHLQSPERTQQWRFLRTHVDNILYETFNKLSHVA